MSCLSLSTSSPVRCRSSGVQPHAVAHNEQYRQLIGDYMLRHKVKPGITGWAQINGWRGETDTLEKMEAQVEFDLYYIRMVAFPRPQDHLPDGVSGLQRHQRVLATQN